MTLTLFALLALAVAASATIKVNHLIQTDSEGYVVQMDVIHDEDAKLVMAIVGDVSKYKGWHQTVNLHDYNVGYGVLKYINKQICILTRPLVPMQPSWKYEVGTTTEVHAHNMRIIPIKMETDEVLKIAGPNIATFCRDYRTYYADVSPAEESGIDTMAAATSGNWCIFSKCSTGKEVLDKL